MEGAWTIVKAILFTRILHWRKQWVSMLFWLLLPIIATATFISIADQWQSDIQIPVGLVIEDSSTIAERLSESISETALLDVKEMSIEQALVELEQHELDSVFVIKDGYQENIKNNSRSQLITAYVSDMSMAYTPVKETIASYVQQDAGSSRAAHIINQMVDHYKGDNSWTWEEIVLTSNQIREDEALLHADFSFYNGLAPAKEETKISLFNIWGIWAFFAFLTTFLIFDWVIKEQRSSMKVRLALLKVPFKSYMLKNAFVYLAVLTLFDLINVTLLLVNFQEAFKIEHVLATLSFRLTISMIAFLLSLYIPTTFFYYICAIIISILLSIVSGAIIPIDGLTMRWSWIKYLSPIHPFLEGEIINSWLIVLLVICFIWYRRKEKAYA